MRLISTQIPEHLMTQARGRSLPHRPVVFVRYYPQIRRWITLRALSPALQDETQDSGASAEVLDVRTGSSFFVTAAHAPLLRQIFGRSSGGVSFSNSELGALERTASVIRVVHLVHGGSPAIAGQPSRARSTGYQSQASRRHHARPGQSLTYNTVPTPPGQQYWTIRWHLSQPSSRGGWIVQHIVMNVASVGGQPGQHLNYWEAWRIPQGSQSTIYLNMIPYDDMFRAPTGSHISGTARFYEGLALPSSFVPNNAATAAGILPATTTDPKLPAQGATKPVNRGWTAP